MNDVITGEGWAVTHLDQLGDGPGFRKIRPALGITAFGMNAIVLPPGAETGRHFHKRQQEVYFLHSGRIEMQFGDGATQTCSSRAALHASHPRPCAVYATSATATPCTSSSEAPAVRRARRPLPRGRGRRYRATPSS
jgi:hypothetical protein